MSRLRSPCVGANQPVLSVYGTSEITPLAPVDEASAVWDTHKSRRMGGMKRAFLDGMNTMNGING
jgi:hypothetical protein